MSIQRERQTAHPVIRVTRRVIRYCVRAYPERVSSLLIRPVWTRRHRLSAVLALARSSGHLHDLSRPTASAPPVPHSRKANDALLPHHTLPPRWSLRFHPAAPAVSTFVKPVGRDRVLDRVRQLTTADQSRTRLQRSTATRHSTRLLDEELTHLGYTIESAFNGETGFAAAKANAPDVIILDLMTPGTSGLEVAGLLKDHPSTARIPILVLTSKEISPRTGGSGSRRWRRAFRWGRVRGTSWWRRFGGCEGRAF